MNIIWSLWQVGLIANVKLHFFKFFVWSRHDKITFSIYFSLRNSYKTLFWTLFNYGDPDHADIVVDNTKVSSINGTVPVVKHKVTEGIGYLIYGTYNVLCVIVLLNMLIAMMARSYSQIEVLRPYYQIQNCLLVFFQF